MITLYWCPRTRAARALWMLEELGEPFRVELVDIRDPESKQNPDFRKASPMGKVPAIMDTLDNGTVYMADSAAICLYLADRYACGRLAPTLDDAARGRYLYWMTYTPGAIEPAMMEKFNGLEVSPGSCGWGNFDIMVEVLERGAREVAGQFIRERGIGLVIPDNPKIAHRVLIAKGETAGAKHGHMVVAEILDYPTHVEQATGRIVEVLGAPGEGREPLVVAQAEQVEHPQAVVVDEAWLSRTLVGPQIEGWNGRHDVCAVERQSVEVLEQDRGHRRLPDSDHQRPALLEGDVRDTLGESTRQTVGDRRRHARRAGQYDDARERVRPGRDRRHQVGVGPRVDAVAQRIGHAEPIPEAPRRRPLGAELV